MNYKHVVTSFLMAEQRILLLHRSDKVGTHRGKWSGVSGYLEGDEQPLMRALTEIREETGLSAEQVSLVRMGEALRAFDESTGTVWIIHPFLFETKSNAIRLDWENTEYAWVAPSNLTSYDMVPKLGQAFDRVRFDLQSVPASLTDVTHNVEALKDDKVHGASYFARRAVGLLSEAAQASDATDADSLFSHLLFTTSRLRRVQPAMANVWNLTGKFLYLVDQQRGNASVEELRSFVQKLAQQLSNQVNENSEEVSRNSVHVLPQDGIVLTHSYSSTVFRTLELGFKGGRHFSVYATESYPGMEGKQFAKDLIALGVPVTLIADSAVPSVISNVRLVLVGADSVLRDGSLVHKTRTREIGIAARKYGVPLYSSCETEKFSIQDFLGERPEISPTLFDVTPPELVSNYMTEEGELAPSRVEMRTRDMQREVYS